MFIEEHHDYCVSIPWDDEGMSPQNMMNNRQVKWHEASMWALENFGLPGGRYSCRPCRTKMEFWFETEQDAILFQIKWS